MEIWRRSGAERAPGEPTDGRGLRQRLTLSLTLNLALTLTLTLTQTLALTRTLSLTLGTASELLH